MENTLITKELLFEKGYELKFSSDAVNRYVKGNIVIEFTSILEYSNRVTLRRRLDDVHSEFIRNIKFFQDIDKYFFELKLTLTPSEQELLLNSMESAISILSWGNYMKEKYKSPDEQKNEMYNLLNKIINL